MLGVGQLAFGAMPAGATGDDVGGNGILKNTSKITVGVPSTESPGIPPNVQDGALGVISARLTGSNVDSFCCSDVGGLVPTRGAGFAVNSGSSIFGPRGDHWYVLSVPTISGTGSSGDPWVITRTYSNADNPSDTQIAVTETTTLASGSSTAKLKWTVTNTTGSPLYAYFAGDLYAPGSTSSGLSWTGLNGSSGGNAKLFSSASDGTAIELTESTGQWTKAVAADWDAVRRPTESPGKPYDGSFFGNTPVNTSSSPHDGAFGVQWTLGDGTAPQSVGLDMTLTPPPMPLAPQLSGIPDTSNTSVTAAFQPGVGDISTVQYTCRLDTGSFETPCATPKSLTNLSLGSHTFKVKAINRLGVEGPWTSKTWTVSTAPAAPTITAADRTASGQVDLTFTPPGSSGITGYEYTINGSTWVSATVTGSGSNSKVRITGLTNGTTYPIGLRATSTDGPGAAATQNVKAAWVPMNPVFVSAEPGDAEVLLTFSEPDSRGEPIDSYQVVVDSGSPQTVLTQSDGPNRTMVVTGLNNGQLYSFHVRAVNTVGAGDLSGARTATPAGVPAPIAGIQSVPGNASAVVSWDIPANNGSAIDGYTLSFDEGNTWTSPVTTTPGGNGRLQTSLTGLNNGETYYVLVRAHNGVGYNSTPNQTSFTPSTLPAAPDLESVTTGFEGGKAIATWVPSNNGGSEVLGWEISTDDGATYTPVSPDWDGRALSTILTGLTNGATYPVRVHAINANGTSPQSNAVSIRVYGLPGAITGFTAIPEDGKIKMSWLATNPNGAPGLVYELYLDDNPWEPIMATTANGRMFFTLNNLVNGEMHEVGVRAVNPAGYHGLRSSFLEVTPAGLPLAPAPFTAVAGNGQIVLDFGGADGNGAPISGYEYSLNGGTTWVTGTVENIVGGKRITLTGLTNGTAYGVAVRGVNSVGVGAGTPVLQRTPVGPATAPRDVAVLSQDGALKLTWKAPASTGGATITRYRVSTDGGSTFAPVTATEADGIFSLTLGSLTNGTTYAVQVRAETSFGLGAASASINGKPYLAATPTAVTATAGTSSVTASWTAPSPSTDITGYTVYAEPGPATCTTSSPSATSCVLGAEAGTAYKVRVVARGANGTDSVPTAWSNTVTPTSPVITTAPPETELTLTTDKGMLTEADPGQEIVVIGTGFAPHSTVKIIVYSDPIVLATVVTDANGDFSEPVTVPADLVAGEHTFVASGVDPQGEVRVMNLPVTVSGEESQAGGGGSGATPAKPTTDLPKTGGSPWVLLLTALSMLAAGSWLVRLRRRIES